MPWAPEGLTREEMARYYDLVCDDELWGIGEVAAALKLKHQTVLDLRSDGKMPPVDEGGFGNPRWHAGTVRHWAMETGRMLPDGTPVRKKRGQPRLSAQEIQLVVADASLEELVADRTEWTTERIAEELKVAYSTVSLWRTRELLPPPDVPHPVRLIWYAGTIRAWAMRTGRMRLDGTPKAAPLGRPRGSGAVRV